ncbi:hypothetical protein, partial [Psychrobacter celer]|uniref:hypothetical protein n=1 Tax=Psychrobacter celer TaxID=306572 RepID=UPI003FD2470D
AMLRHQKYRMMHYANPNLGNGIELFYIKLYQAVTLYIKGLQIFYLKNYYLIIAYFNDINHTLVTVILPVLTPNYFLSTM